MNISLRRLGLPIIGNLLDIPPQHSWFKFHDLIKQYGPIVQLNVAGQPHVLLGSEKVANALLTERGNIYSDRPILPSVQKFLTRSQHILVMPYGDRWRQQRAFVHRMTIQPAQYDQDQRLEILRMMHDLIVNPSDYHKLIEGVGVGFGSRLLYAQRADRHSHHQQLLEIVREIERTASPGAYLVDLLPSLAYMPSFVAPWKRYLESKYREHAAFYGRLMADTRRDLTSGKDVRSWARAWIESPDQSWQTEAEGEYMLGAMYTGIGSLSAAQMIFFMLSMVRHPHLFARLQEEIERVVGDTRLPTIDDGPQLPLLRAIIKETIRYYPTTAGGFPHMLIKDDVYEGYYLKAGTVVHPVQWAIHRDPELYPDPEVYNPYRWLQPEFPTYREPLTKYPSIYGFSAFGHGRRICQGMQLAERGLIMQIALFAWTCDLKRAKDGDGNEIIPPKYDFTVGFNVAPRKFSFELKPRDDKRWAMFKATYEQSLRDDPLL
ncbi:cytochrome P450 [Thozetella sp. PMI_491]|nr:cytochrome P450 [Thozetella sp. PMI_491]